ncbi:hypothetical protein CPB85DRAFT_1451526 [Mucidula mucida]|nr:hypothetical protein CPB85DRAFT_1451526 [Mucidula mucida]
MTVSTAPALLLGLGARILLDQLTRSDDSPSLPTAILPAVWQGVALCYAAKEHNLAIPIAVGIAAKLYLEYAFIQDATKSIIAILGVVLGFYATDYLSAFIDNPIEKRSSTSSSKKPHQSSGHAHASAERERQRDRERSSHHRRRSEDRDTRDGRQSRSSRRTTSDITEVDSNSEMIDPKGSLSPLDREIKALRARASLADSERRRFKEEKKWAIEQGNMELATQLSWQVKRYSTLMKSFHREADTKLIEASMKGPRLNTIQEDDTIASTSVREVPIVSVDIAQSKSGFRVNVR